MGEKYKFRHYSSSTNNPIYWETTRDFIVNKYSHSKISPRDKALYETLFKDTTNDNLFTYLGADTEFTLEKKQSRNSKRAILNKVVVEVNVEENSIANQFYNYITIDAEGIDNDIPIFVFDKTNNNNNYNYFGRTRSLFKKDKVKVAAIKSINNKIFSHCENQYSEEISSNSLIELDIKATDYIKAVYKKIK